MSEPLIAPTQDIVPRVFVSDYGQVPTGLLQRWMPSFRYDVACRCAHTSSSMTDMHQVKVQALPS
jgi:hypothetical protein